MWNMAIGVLIIVGALEVFRKGLEKRLREVRIEEKIEIIRYKLATIVEGDQNALFSIATTSRCRGGRYSFPYIAPLYPRYVPYITE